MRVTTESNWTTTMASRALTVINELTSGNQHCFRGVAIGAETTLVYSDNFSSFFVTIHGF